MSIFSSWSYNTLATFWAPTFDEYMQPSAWTRHTFYCSFRTGGREDSEEFVPNYVICLESAVVDAPQTGWKVMLSDVADASPPAAAQVIREARQYDAATFREGLPDWELLT